MAGEVKPLPCPFCGSGDAPKLGGLNLNAGGGSRSVSCSRETGEGWIGCGASGPSYRYSTRPPRKGEPDRRRSVEDAERLALDGWNEGAVKVGEAKD